MEDIIKEIRDEFLAETQDLLEEYQEILNTIDSSLDSQEIDSIFRIVHTLKGNSKACDFQEFSHHIHDFENLLEKYRSSNKIIAKEFKEINFSFLSELFNVLDSLKNDFESEASYDYSKFDKIVSDGFVKKHKFLIVDDDTVMLDLISTIIKEQYENSQVDVFSNSSKALEVLQKTKYDIIISDYNMPNLNGTDLLKGTKETEFNSKTPFIFITGFKPPINERGEFYDNVFFLEKPFEEKRVFYYIHCSLRSAS